jgi:hypothetical protein
MTCEVQPTYAARFRCASALSSPVRLCIRSLDRRGQSVRVAPAFQATPCPEFAEGLVVVMQAALVSLLVEALATIGRALSSQGETILLS